MKATRLFRGGEAKRMVAIKAALELITSQGG